MSAKKNINEKLISASKKKIFRYWLEFLRPYHKLRSGEIEALTLMLHYRYELSREVSSPELVNRLLFSTETRKKMMIDLNNMSPKVFNNLLSTLRKKKVLSRDNKILPALIPNMTENGFKLIFNFKVDETK